MADAAHSTTAPAVETYDVVIVGGGVAGVAAAMACAQRGQRVCVVESRPILGGRARSWVDSATRDPIHIGPHVVVDEYPNFFHLLTMLGTREKIVMQPWRHFVTWVRGMQEFHIRSKPLPAPAAWGATSVLDPFVRYADKHSTVPAALHCLSLSEEEVLELDGETGEEFLRRLGVTDAYIQHFWAFLCHAILNVPVEEVSAAAMVSFFRRLAGRSNMGMGFSDGGLGNLLTPAKGLLEEMGGTVLLSTEVVSFVEEEGRCAGVVLDDGRTLRAGLGVVSTLPPQTLLPVLPPQWVEAHPSIAALEKLKVCKYACVYLWFDRKISGGKQMWARTYNKNDLNCEFYDFSEIYSGTDAHGVLWKDRPSFIGSNIIDAGRLGDDVTDEDLIEVTMEELRENLPLASEAVLLRSRVNRVPMAIHRPVRNTEKLRPDQETPVPGLFFGGCWTRTGFPSSMESAAHGGFLAAEKLLNNAGFPGPVAVRLTEIDLSARVVGKIGNALRPVLLDPFFKMLVWISGGASPVSASEPWSARRSRL